MSSTWNGSALQIRYAQKYGFSDSTSLVRVLEWVNDVQNDICASHSWPFLKFKLKREVTSSEHEIDISVPTPSAVTIALLAGGSITTASAVYVKCTFVIFDESGKEINSIESEPSIASNTVTTSGSDLSLTVSSIPLYSGSTSVNPTTIYRRIYLKIASGNYYLSKTIENNTATTTTITTTTTSVVEPPEYSLVSCLSGEDPFIEGSGYALYEKKLDDILKYDPNFSSSGTPQYYARVGTTKILLYPKPSAAITLSYWVYRIPSRIFADTDRPIQLYHALKETLDAGVTWKFYEYKDSDGQESKKMNYEARKQDAKGIIGRSGGQAMSVKVVC